MAKKKVVRKVAKKAPARKVSRPSRSASSSSKGFFETHKNLKWIIPLFIVLLVAVFVFRHFVEERMEVGENPIKQDVRNMLRLNNETDDVVLTVTPTPADNSTITPYITVTPTPESMGY